MTKERALYLPNRIKSCEIRIVQAVSFTCRGAQVGCLQAGSGGEREGGGVECISA